ncbi:hypothetical protein THRCLA_21376 [Thraustotheca clavata]|uniref:Transmembrane protein n=1 Tax=Thraustotheca clavata TaxID=74557 RepID=A0A1V9ZX63_9STRA|nr:hypothetical protein THRCLA_21376 [Thraustotheca clavata]
MHFDWALNQRQVLSFEGDVEPLETATKMVYFLVASTTVAAANLYLIDEVASWESYNIESLDIQWQNYKRIEVVNSYDIINAYGVVYEIPLMTLNLTYLLASQTTFKMYWSLFNDVFSIVNNSSGMEHKSLLRGSTNFAFRNLTPQSIVTRNLTLMTPLANGLILIQDTIGPLGMTDMIYVKVPRNVSYFFIEFTKSILAKNISAQIAYTNITPLGISYPVPKKWIVPKYYSYGSLPLCQELRTGKTIPSGFLNFLSYDLTCQPTLPINAKVVPTRQHYILSANLSGFLSIASNDSKTICSYDASYLTLCLLAADIAQYCRAAVWYMTFIMLCIATITCCYMGTSQFQFVGANMFNLCRAGGMVWVGRPLLFLRSLPALCLLSTSSGETTWLVFVVNDIVLVLTREYSLYYESPSVFIIWVVGGVLSLMQPIQSDVIITKEYFLDGIEQVASFYSCGTCVSDKYIKLWRIFITPLYQEQHLRTSPIAFVLATAYPLINQAKE